MQQCLSASLQAPAARRPSGGSADRRQCRRLQQLQRGCRSRGAAVQASAEAATNVAAQVAAAAAPATAASTSSSASTSSTSSQASSTAIEYTSFEGNSFRVRFPKSGVSVLVDPWLVGKLTFGGLDFMYAGSKRVATPEALDVDAIAAETDFIVLTQGIDDHAHRPTLQRLPKTIPVVASPAGAAVARACGFRTVYTLRAGQTLGLLGGRVTIQGTAGALVGPPWSERELGVVLRDAESGTSLYYEPHADYLADSVARVAPVDVVVSPPCSQVLLGYPLVKGASDTLGLLRLLRPRAYVPLLNAEFEQAGPLADLLEEQGGVEQIQAQLAAAGGELAGLQVCVPRPAQPLALDL